MPIEVSRRRSNQEHFLVCDSCDQTWIEHGHYASYTSDCNPGEHVSDESYEPPRAGYCYYCCDKYRDDPKRGNTMRREVTKEEFEAFQEAAKVRAAKADLHDS